MIKAIHLRLHLLTFSNYTMSQIFETIKKKVAEAEAEVTKFNDGNNAAGGRVRKAMQELKDLAQELRKEVLETKSTRKTTK